MKTGHKSDSKPEYAEMFEIGQPTELIVLEDGNPRRYASQIQDLTDDEMFVTAPTYRGVSVHVAMGADITVSSLVAGARYMATARVLSREHIPIEVLKLVRPATVRRVQLRENFRMEIRIPDSTLHLQPTDDPNVLHEFAAEILNVSAGGARFVLGRKIPTNKDAPSVKYWLEFPLDFENPLGVETPEIPDVDQETEAGDKGKVEAPQGPEIVSLPLRVIGVDKTGEGQSERVLVRGQFIDPSAPVQNRIRRFVNVCQMAQRRRRFGRVRVRRRRHPGWPALPLPPG